MYETKFVDLLKSSVSAPLDFFRVARRFARNQRGNVGAIFAISLIPIMMMAGGAVDYGGLVEKKAHCQSALDSAILAAATINSTNPAYLQSIFSSNIGTAKITLTNISISTYTDASNRTVYVGDVSYDVKTSFLGLVGIDAWHAKSHAEAYSPAQRIVNVTFKPTNAQGAFSKDVFIWTKNASGVITMQQNVMTYRWNGVTRTTSPAIGSWSTTFTVPAYSTFGVGLVIYDSTATGYNGALINPTTKYSDTNASSWIHQTGNCTDAGGQTTNMEDGGDSNYLDFVYNMTCTLGPAANATARLSK